MPTTTGAPEADAGNRHQTTGPARDHVEAGPRSTEGTIPSCPDDAVALSVQDDGRRRCSTHRQQVKPHAVLQHQDRRQEAAYSACQGQVILIRSVLDNRI